MGLRAHPRKGKRSLESVDLVHSLNRGTQESKSHNPYDGDPPNFGKLPLKGWSRASVSFLSHWNSEPQCRLGSRV